MPIRYSGTDNALTFNLGVTNVLETTTRSIYARTTSGTGQANLCSWNGNTNNLFTITEQWQRFVITNSSSVAATSFYGVDFRGTTNLFRDIYFGVQMLQMTTTTLLAISQLQELLPQG